jgi:ATP-dependent RNA helicase RhlE
MTFSDFDIDPRVLSVLDAKDITTPSAIQEKAIPIALEGRDLTGVAQTGTGKTLAFTLPALTRLAQGPFKKNMMLVLTPTRELCEQVHGVVNEIGKPLKLRSVAVYGGTRLDRQADALKKGRAVVCATPGRLLDHMGRGNVRFDNLQILVLDEFDRMLDMGFLPDIRRIVAKLPEDRQTLMFSATFPDEIRRFTERMMRDPAQVQVGITSKPVDKVEQRIFAVYPEDKLKIVTSLLEEKDIESALIFARTKARTDHLYHVLKRKGFEVAAIHGDRSQKRRQQALDGFRSGKYRILVATDVAARGLDISGISHVINYDVPQTADDYIHRIGRTARAGAAGEAFTFVIPQEHDFLATIERALGRPIPRAEVERPAPVLSIFERPRTGTRRGVRRVATRRQRRVARGE